MFFDIKLLSFPCLLGANLWRGSFRRFRYKLIQLSCTAHDKIIIIIIIIIVIIFTVHRQKVESTCAVKTRRMELTAHYRKKTFWNSLATFCSFSERCETYHIAFVTFRRRAAKYFTQTWHAWINQICLRSFRGMLIWYGSKVPRERIMWIEIYACSFFFCNDSTLFLICSIIADAITTFLLDGRSYFFHSLSTSTLPLGKDLSCLDNRQNKTWSLEDLEFVFSCSARAHQA